MKYLVNRLIEPSTYAGLSAVLLTAGLSVPGWYGPVTHALAAAAGVAAFFLAERKNG